MNAPKDLQNHEFLVKAPVIIVAAIASVPIWIAMDFLMNSIGVGHDEAIATAVTIFFMASIFVGRYFAELLMIRIKNLRNLALAVLLTLIISSIALFAQLAFPFEGSAALHLLLYWLPFLISSITLGMLIKIVRSIGKKELQEARSVAAHSQSELHLLQSQLSPHFLFNTLNNLYGLSITQHEKIPPLLLKLSDLLRYSVYDSGENFVPLKSELEYIDNYIEFEKIRIGERLVLKTDIEKATDTNIKIAPMLLIVFIENAFKHSKNTADDLIYIDISLKTWNNLILFSIKNSFSKSSEENKLLNKNSGFGLANVKKRLDLLYPNDYELTITEDVTSYQVILRLKVK
ncbi:sensor histidine kinase [Dyadobacter sp. CY323]|uniref:sensor histidine kinase n=1 Tax=Dyadobacter sp. CY323 TaxID=2907302 RepID=UPI001F354B65|nr:histidine kinase [Dyadobacter sp. CY323]MCE6988709.1 histidine kinase [Dyadobacter sp. CY323]